MADYINFDDFVDDYNLWLNIMISSNNDIDLYFEEMNKKNKNLLSDIKSNDEKIQTIIHSTHRAASLSKPQPVLKISKDLEQKLEKIVNGKIIDYQQQKKIDKINNLESRKTEKKLKAKKSFVSKLNCFISNVS